MPSSPPSISTVSAGVKPSLTSLTSDQSTNRNPSTMSPNSDNAMARFLFAILKQKNLKDVGYLFLSVSSTFSDGESIKIDWNLVANDPVLLQPITNGHAARMRYSRFRTTVTGADTQKRNRVEGKSRVTKGKSKSGSVKSESNGTHIKQEHSQPGVMSQYSPMSAASPYLTENSDDFSARFLTPCSDDMTQGLAIHPALVHDSRRQAPPVDFTPSLDFMNNSAHPYSPTFSAFDDATIDMSTFSTDSNVSNLADCTADWNNRLPQF